MKAFIVFTRIPVENKIKYRADDELQNMSIKKRVGNVPQKDANGNFEYKKEYALDVTTASSATAAIHVYDNAISRVSSMRSSLGASQNRLEHTIKTLDSSAENITQTMSKIQDTDIAEQMSEFTKYNILQQSGTSMLTQANQLPQMILKLESEVIDGYISERPEALTAETANSNFKMIQFEKGFEVGEEARDSSFPKESRS